MLEVMEKALDIISTREIGEALVRKASNDKRYKELNSKIAVYEEKIKSIKEKVFDTYRHLDVWWDELPYRMLALRLMDCAQFKYRYERKPLTRRGRIPFQGGTAFGTPPFVTAREVEWKWAAREDGKIGALKFKKGRPPGAYLENFWRDRLDWSAFIPLFVYDTPRVMQLKDVLFSKDGLPDQFSELDKPKRCIDIVQNIINDYDFDLDDYFRCVRERSTIQSVYKKNYEKKSLTDWHNLRVALSLKPPEFAYIQIDHKPNPLALYT